MALLYIQCDWNEALESEDGKAWITFKQKDHKGQRAFLKQMPSSENPETPCVIATSKDFHVSNPSSKSLIIHFKGHESIFKVLAPTEVFNSIHLKSIASLDVSSGGLGVSAGDDGIYVWENENGLIRRKLGKK